MHVAIMKTFTLLSTLPILLAYSSPILEDGTSGPSVTLDSVTVTGIEQGALTKFLGIPFAAPP